MAFTLFSYPDANNFSVAPAGVVVNVVVPPTLVAAYEDFEFEFLFPNVSSSHSGATASLFPTLTTAATSSMNWAGLGNPVIIGTQTGNLAFIRDVYGLISRQTTIRIFSPADLQFRITVLGVS